MPQDFDRDRSVAADNVRRYVKQLRESLGVTQDALAHAVGISERAYAVWEKGSTGDIKSVLLMRVLEFLKGSADEVQKLAIADMQEQLSQEQQRLINARVLALAAELGDEELGAALEAIRDLRGDPTALARLVGYANRLREERMRDADGDDTPIQAPTAQGAEPLLSS